MISLLGRMLGDYRLEMTIGTGALGETFRARDVRDGSLAAVKVIHPALAAEPRFSERFREAAEAAARIRHPNVLAIRDYGDQTGRFYIAMEFVVGGSLRTLLHRRQTQLPLPRALAYLRQATAGLGAAHRQRVLHRDLKPENLLVDADGGAASVRLADVGLTRLADSGLTIGGTLAVGSLPYMAPEHLRGLAPDERSDLYSLGIVLYEAVTGHPPFQVTTLGEALAKHSGVAPPAPRSVVRDLPASVEQLVLRCLEKDPAARFQTAAELEDALAAEASRLDAGAARPAAPAEGPIVVLRDTPPAPPDAGRPAEPTPRRYRVRLDGADAPATPADPATPSPPPARDVPRTATRDGDDDERPTLPELVHPALASAPAARPTPSGASGRNRIALDRDVLSLTPGQQAVLAATVMNGGRTVDHFTVTVSGVPAAWVRGPAQAQQLNPGQRAVVALNVLVPREPASTAGTYPVTVHATSRENRAESAAVPATWTVQQFVEPRISLDPARARAWRRSRFGVVVRNDGNSEARFRLSAADEEHALRYDFADPEPRLAAGGELTVPLTLRGRLRLIGSPETRSFTTRADPVGDGVPASSAATATGQLVHRAVLPSWLPPLLILAAAALAFLLRGRGDVQLTVTPPAVQVAVGSTAPLVAAVMNRKNEILADRPIAYVSRDTAIATVSDSGIVAGHREGTTVVQVASGKVTSAVQVAVVAPKVERVAVSPQRLTLAVGRSATLRAVASDAAGGALRRDATWQSSDPTVATVGGNGRVTAKGAGSATITAQIEGRSGTADVTVPQPADTGGGAPADTDDCVAYDPGPLRVSKDKAAGWVVSDGKVPVLTLDNERDAKRALALARRYRSHCFLGRANARPNRSDYVIEYWKDPTGAPSVIEREDCVAYDRASLKVAQNGGQGFLVADRNRRLVAADTRDDAQRAWQIAQGHRMLCYIGRGNRRPNQRDYVVQYWR